LAVGAAVGEPVGDAVGPPVGDAVGCAVGVPVGAAVGLAVGVALGAEVGARVGTSVGAALSPHGLVMSLAHCTGRWSFPTPPHGVQSKKFTSTRVLTSILKGGGGTVTLTCGIHKPSKVG
jgi:hypothetical protein